MGKGLITAYLLDGQGFGKKIEWKEIEEWSPRQGVLWVHLDYTAPEAVAWLRKSSQLDNYIVKAMIQEETRPRTLITNKGICVFLRGVNLSPGEEPEDMVSIRVWIDENRIITTRKRHLLSTDDVKRDLEKGVGPVSSADFLLSMNDKLIARMSEVLGKIDDQVDELEAAVITEESRKLRAKLSDIRRQTILIRRYLAPQREALNKLHLEVTPYLGNEQRIHIREAMDRVTRFIEDLDAARDRAAIIQEELMSRISEQTDNRMYLLSLVAVIFMPLTFITGLLGINVGGIPGGSSPFAFTLVCIMLIVLGAVTLIIFKRKKWM